MRKPAALLLIVLLPAAGAVAGWFAAPIFARAHYMVRQADQVRLEAEAPDTPRTLETDAFRAHGTTPEDLYAQAAAVERRFRIGAPILGAFAGLVFALLNVGLNAERRREIYEIDYSACVACGRCFSWCPIEQRRRKRDAEGKTTTRQQGATT